MAKTTGVSSPGLWSIFQQDLAGLSRTAQSGLAALGDWLFAFNQEGARRRMTLFLTASVIIWFGFALLVHPIRVGREPVVLQLLHGLFSVDVWRHLIVLALGLWVGLRMASIYLDDIFELNNVYTAEHFLREAVFPGPYHMITIKDGDVAPHDQDSPVYKIGGPGVVDVHMENVALFEKVDGRPHVIEPSRSRMEVLEGFERLRAVIDLRDQVLELPVVEGRTQDGIPVQAQDVRLVFSVYRGEQQPGEGKTYTDPMPFDKQAVEALVYKQGTGSWYNAMRGLIISELRDFISRHTLSEFLSNADPKKPGSEFVPRDQLTQLFYDFTHGFSRRAAERGVQLSWIGVGTWVTPSEIIPSRHLDAWKLSSENRARRNPGILEGIRKEARTAELLHLVDDLLANFHRWSAGEEKLPEKMMIRKLLLLYRERLRHAQELYAAADGPDQPDVDEVLRYLSFVTGIRPNKKPGDGG
jgi:hypothetical protein